MLTDRKVYRWAAFGRTYVQFYIPSVPINQSSANFGLITPYQGYPVAPWGHYGWYVENVQSFCTAITATANYWVAIVGGANMVANGSSTPAAGAVTPGAGGSLMALSTPSRRGKITDQLVLVMNSDGTGTITNLLVTVTLRPYPLDGEAA